jgi:thiol-disulfide isomerase/thioredoxin
MKSQQKIFIIATIAAIVIVVGLGVFLNRPTGPSKYLDFAKTLVTDNAQFYGAFWCPHCQAQEKDFAMSRQDLEKMGLYHECSNADQSQTPICIDKKVESYPTWYFKDGITVTSEVAPVVCKPRTSTTTPDPTENPVCAKVASQYYPTYLFASVPVNVRSDTPPVHAGNNWKFPVTASTTGELPLPFIAQQIKYTLPQ